MTARMTFKKNDWVVYPTHGVGKVTGIEDQEIEGCSLKLLVISFEKDRMTLRVRSEGPAADEVRVVGGLVQRQHRRHAGVGALEVRGPLVAGAGAEGRGERGPL